MKSNFYSYVGREHLKIAKKNDWYKVASTYKYNLENSDFSDCRYDTFEIK